MKHLTIRGLSPSLARALEREVRQRGRSLNETVKELLERALGLGGEEKYDNGLGKYAGGWSAAELKQFERATELFERVDDEQWK